MEPRFPIKERGRGERILVVQTSYLGDVVLTTPVLAELRRRFCEAEVTVLCTPEARGLLDGNPDIQEILTDDKRGKDRGFRGLWRKAEELHRRHFTIALSPHKSLRTALLLFLAGVPCRVGFRQSAGWFFYHYCVSRDSNRHDTERNLSILEPLVPDWAGCRRDLRVEVDGGTREEVRHLFSSLGVGGKARRLFFGLNPGSVWPTKRWSVQGYADLMRRLKEKYDCEILLFGGAQDRRIVAQIQRLSGFAGVDLTGRIGLRELPGALEWCDVFITNDSGPMHVAVARGISVVAIFCATTPSLGFYPYTSNAVVLEKALSCRPCASHGGRRCPLGTEECIHGIGSEDVLRGVEMLLKVAGTEVSTSHSPPVPHFITL